MKRTPHYLLQFYQRGDLYSASEDLQRMTTIDNQLIDLSEISGDGVLFGWNIYKTKDLDPSASDLGISVSVGSGLISNLYQVSLGTKQGTVIDNSVNYVYLQTSAFNAPGSFPLEVQGPLSSPAAMATFLDTTPPSAPTNFDAQAVSYDIVNLIWDANTESDVVSYEIQRSLNASFSPAVVVANPTTNGTASDPFQDTGLEGNTDYYYRIRATDKSGNQSSWTLLLSSFVTTLADTRTAAEVTNLGLIGGDTELSIAFLSASTENLQSYKITVDQLRPDGSIEIPSVWTPASESLDLFCHATGLPNNKKFRVTVQTRATSDDGTTPPGNLSAGIQSEVSTAQSSAPYDVLDVTTTSGIGKITFNWIASPSPSSSSSFAISGYKVKYLIIPIIEGKEALPIDVGLSLTYDVYGYNEILSVGFGPTKKFAEKTDYFFKICTEDGYGNRSLGTYAIGSVQATTPPNKPRAFYAEAGDKQGILKWNHSTSEGVVGYVLSYNQGGPYSPEILLPYINEYDLTGLTNNLVTNVRIRTKNDAGLFSGYVTTVFTLVEDLAEPPIPLHLRLAASDREVKVTWESIDTPDIIKYIIQKTLVNAPANFPPNVIPEVLATYSLDVGLTNEFIDTGIPIPLENGKQYGYAIKAVRVNPSGTEIEGQLSGIYYVSPNEGNNTGPDKFDAPTNVSAFFDSLNSRINLAWNFYFHDMVYNPVTQLWEYPVGNGPTAFNIYRSTHPLSGYQLITTVSAGVRGYYDRDLVGGQTYYYIIAAMRDNIYLVIDTGTIQPVHSILLGSVTASSGAITAISHEQRLIYRLQSVIEEETLRRLLEHKHSLSPLNTIDVTAQSSITMVEANSLREDCFSRVTFTCDDTLNPSQVVFYQKAIIESESNVSQVLPNNIESPEGIPISGVSTYYSTQAEYVNYDPNTVYLIDPRLVVWNLPYVGDFQVLVNNSKPTVPFSIDHDINAIVFDQPLQDSDVVRLDGQGYTFYIPAKIDRDYYGYDILINDVKSSDCQVSEASQTITLGTPLDMDTEPIVIARLDPVVPDFGTQFGVKQVNLSPNIILNDFVPQGLSVYKSESGAFYDGDSVFVLVNGQRTTLDHYVDFTKKLIVFFSPLSSGTDVALEIKNVEETTNELPEDKFSGIDGSQVKSGTLLEAQLPDISHEGRVRERAYPVFFELASDDNYVYSSSETGVGTSTTTYDFHVFDDGNFMLGTSKGILRTYLIPGFLISSTDDLLINSATPIGGGVNFGRDTILEAALIAAENSGRVYGSLSFPATNLLSENENINIQNPSTCILDTGNVFICGGIESLRCFSYNPALQTAVEVAPMSSVRIYHGCVKLPDGRVVVCGGVTSDPSICRCLTATEFTNLDKTDGIIGSWFLKSAAIYDPSAGPSGTWSSLPDMSAKRMNHASVVVNPNDLTSPVLVAGGKWSYRLSATDFFEQTVVSCPNTLYCDPESSDIKYDQAIRTVELLDPVSLTWTSVNSMVYPGETCKAKSDGENVVITTSKSRQIYNYAEDSWQTSSGQCNVSTVGIVNEDVDGPVRDFLKDDQDRLLASVRKNVFYSEDNGRSWVSMKGLDAIGVIHSICQGSNSTLYAATDLGVYEIKNNIGITWLQGGLIGSGTTETFAVVPVESKILAGTEIGIFSSADNGDTWLEVSSLPDITALEYVGSGLVYAISGQDLYKSESYGNAGTWEKIGIYQFIDSYSKIASRMPFELFISSDEGLYRSTDGMTFTLVPFDINKNASRNNVQRIRMIGTDLYISYDNEVLVLDPSGKVYLLASFTGNIPTVRINGEELRTGFQYDTKNNQIIFETKRFSDDIVKLASNYSLYELNGGWYSQNPNATLQVYVNQITQSDSVFIYDARLGKISFTEMLNKYDEVTVSIAGTSLKDPGMYFHTELEDKLEKEKGLPLSMGRDLTGNILQMGLSIEHNFLERGTERNQYYCLQTSPIDRSFSDLLLNSEFFILGRKEFDRFNSTIDYKIESEQTLMGSAALVPLCGLSYSATSYWVGTDSGIFMLNPSTLFSLSSYLQIKSDENSVRNLTLFGEDIYAATSLGIYRIYEQGGNFLYEKNPMQGLPDEVYTITSLNNYLIAGTSDGMYYATSFDDPAYSIWYRANHIPQNGQPIELVLDGNVDSTFENEGTIYSAIGKDIFLTNDAKIWKRVYSFPVPANPSNAIRVSRMTFFGGKVYLATNRGVYDDDGSIKSEQVTFKFDAINGTTTNSIISMNYISSNEDVLYASANDNYLYRLKNQTWGKVSITEAKAIHLVDLLGRTVLAIENNTVYTEP